MSSLTSSFVVKIEKLLDQITISRLADYVYPDGDTALSMLETKARSLLGRVTSAASYSDNTQKAVLREANATIARLTNVTGIITRSTTICNAFELYSPFLKICRALLGDNARLLLTAEWQYVPFTYPQTLADLPKFIVIGLPAPESDNVLIFPAAGHELGHSIWSDRGLRDHFTPNVNSLIERFFTDNAPEIKNTFPEFKDADLNQDIFAVNIKSAVFNCILAQAEEFFCDIVGLLLFGESYLLMFSYLIAPQLTGSRSMEYPDTVRRVEMLMVESQRFGIPVEVKIENFIKETPRSSKEETYIIRVADEVISNIQNEISVAAENILSSAMIERPTIDATESVHLSFQDGIPFQGDATLGDLINAAWREFRKPASEEYKKQGRKKVDYLADLVMKSSEIHELRDFV